MWSRRIATVAGVVLVSALAAVPAWATDVAADTTMSAIQAGVTADGIINFTANAVLTIDANGTGVATISVQNGVSATITFGANSYRIIFKNAAGAITLLGNGQLTISGTGPNAGFDFSSVASGKTLTITSSSANSLGDSAAANRIILGNTNTLTFAASGGAANALNEVNVASGAEAIIDATENVTVETLTLVGDLDMQMAAGVTVTVNDAVSVPAGGTLMVTGTDGALTETIEFTNGLDLSGSGATLTVTGDDTDAVVVSLPTAGKRISVSADGGAINLVSSVTLTGAAANVKTRPAAFWMSMRRAARRRWT